VLAVPVKKPKATWVRPIVDAEIEYGALTDDGLLREAVFKGLRDDLALPVHTPARSGRGGACRARIPYSCCRMRSWSRYVAMRGRARALIDSAELPPANTQCPTGVWRCRIFNSPRPSPPTSRPQAEPIHESNTPGIVPKGF
jgi:hypothetical protein